MIASRRVRSAPAIRIAGLGICLVCAWGSSASLTAQWHYEAVNVTTPDPEGFVSVVAPATCNDGGSAVPYSGYLKQSTPIKIDAHATVTGVCQHKYGSLVVQQWLRGITASA